MKWVLPLLVALTVFVLSQAIQDNPLPNIAASSVPALQPESISLRDITLDDTLEAELIIDRLGIAVPIVWSQSTKEADLQKDLEHGALRYPGTPEPGNIGNSFVTAHSSDYPWKSGIYKKAFSKLGKLEVGNDDIIVVYKKNGEFVRQIRFKVTEKAIVKATDMRMIEQKEKTEMTLVTCWPVGTNLLRLMVKTERIDE